MKIIATVLLSLFLAAPAFAASSNVIDSWSLYTFFDSFNWREYKTPSQRLLKESGPMYGAGTDLSLNLYDRKLLLKGKGEVSGSVVDYRGQTQENNDYPARSRRPVNTDVTYVGLRLEGDLGWRFPLQRFSLEPFGGVGGRWWLRGLQDSVTTDAAGNPFIAGGYTETWRTAYATVGSRAAYRAGDSLNVFMEGGARYPFYVSNSVDVANVGTVTLRPRGEWSAVGELGADWRHLRVSVHYEGFRVSASPAKSGYLQPQSASDVYGLRIGWSF